MPRGPSRALVTLARPRISGGRQGPRGPPGDHGRDRRGSVIEAPDDTSRKPSVRAAVPRDRGSRGSPVVRHTGTEGVGPADATRASRGSPLGSHRPRPGRNRPARRDALGRPVLVDRSNRCVAADGPRSNSGPVTCQGVLFAAHSAFCRFSRNGGLRLYSWPSSLGISTRRLSSFGEARVRSGCRRRPPPEHPSPTCRRVRRGLERVR